jgi:hypothetical protein
MTAPKNKELIFKDVVRYEDGCLYWAKPVFRSNSKPGDRAGCFTPTGYRTIGYQGIMALEHRIVWMLHHGEIPAGLEIDHINRNPSDNRIENLRLATPRQNKWNRKKQELPICLRHQRGRFQVRVAADGKRHNIGTYDTIQQAVEARDKFLETIGSPADFV